MSLADLSIPYARNADVFWERYRDYPLGCGGRPIEMPLEYKNGTWDVIPSTHKKKSIWKGIKEMFNKEAKMIEKLERDFAAAYKKAQGYNAKNVELRTKVDNLEARVKELTPVPEPYTYELTYVRPDGTVDVLEQVAHTREGGPGYGHLIFRDHDCYLIASYAVENLRSVVKK